MGPRLWGRGAPAGRGGGAKVRGGVVRPWGGLGKGCLVLLPLETEQLWAVRRFSRCIKSTGTLYCIYNLYTAYVECMSSILHILFIYCILYILFTEEGRSSHPFFQRNELFYPLNW